MTFAKNLVGGAVIMVIALIVGVAHNAVRSDPVKLLPKVRTPAAASSASNAATHEAAKNEAAPEEVSESQYVTEDELAAGEVSMARMQTIMEAETAIIIDARVADQFAKGHLPGAMNIPIYDFVEYYGQLDERVPMDAMVIVYCQSVTCDESENLAQELRLMGYERVVVYRGGWDEWSEAGLPVE